MSARSMTGTGEPVDLALVLGAMGEALTALSTKAKCRKSARSLKVTFGAETQTPRPAKD